MDYLLAPCCLCLFDLLLAYCLCICLLVGRIWVGLNYGFVWAWLYCEFVCLLLCIDCVVASLHFALFDLGFYLVCL